MKPFLAPLRVVFSSLMVSPRLSGLMSVVWPLALFALLVSGSQSVRADTNFVTAGSYTWVCPVGITAVKAECWGAGGGSGGCGQYGAAGGGAGGAYARTNVYAVTPGATYYVQVGAAGAGGTAGKVNGSAGGDTWFSNATAVVVLAKGGGFGAFGQTNAIGVADGAGGTCPAGSIGGNAIFLGGAGLTGTNRYAGGGGGGSGGTASNGNPGLTNSAAAAVAGGGPGGAGQVGALTGQSPASGPGGGGGGGLSLGAATKAGANGWGGQVILTYNPGPVFKSIASGDWSNTNTWNVSFDAGSTWAATTLVPNFTNTPAIFITNNFTVTITDSETATNLLVDYGSTLVLSGAGILASTNAGSGTNTFANNILLNGGFTDNNPSSVSTTSEHISGIISGSGGVTNSGGGTLTLAGANTFTGGLYVNNGIVAGTTVNSCFGGSGTGAIMLGSSSGGPATLSTGKSPNNPITLGTSAVGTLIITNIGGTADAVCGGAIDLNGNNLTIGVGGGINLTTTVSGGITGTGNLTLNADTGTNGIILSTNSINNSGSITVQGASTGTNTIGSVIGANVTGVIQNSASSPLILSATNTYTGNTTVNAGTLALSGGGSIASTASIGIAGGAKFDVSGLSSTFTLGSGQTLANISGTGLIAGNLNLASGALALNYTNGTSALQITNGTLNFNGNAVTVNVSGTLTRGTYKIISTNNAGLVAGTLPSSVTVNGIGTVVGSLSISNGELYLTVDHPPVAQAMTVTRTAGLSLMIALSDVATNWSDADGDTVTLAGINLVTTNGVNLQTNSSWIFYTNSPNVNDQISYSISDGYGGTNVAYINIVVTNGVTGNNSITGIATGATNVVTAYGVVGYNYILERATNLAPAVWIPVSTNMAAANGVINATDTFWDLGGTPPGSAYYRLEWKP